MLENRHLREMPRLQGVDLNAQENQEKVQGTKNAPPTESVGAGMPLLQGADLNGRNGEPSGVDVKTEAFI